MEVGGPNLFQYYLVECFTERKLHEVFDEDHGVLRNKKKSSPVFPLNTLGINLKGSWIQASMPYCASVPDLINEFPMLQNLVECFLVE